MGFRPILQTRITITLLAALCTAFECTQSTTPLTPPEDGFVDSSLLGDWHSATFSSDGLIDPMGLVASIETDASGKLLISLHGGDRTPTGLGVMAAATMTFSGYSSRLDGQSYLNLRLVDIDCSTAEEDYSDCEQDKAAVASDEADCPYIVVSYSQDVSADMLDDRWLDDLGRWRLESEVERLKGDLLAIGLMDDDFVRGSVDQGRITEKQECEKCKDVSTCIDVSSKRLQEFITKNNSDIFPVDDSEFFVRNVAAAVYSKGFPIGASRAQLTRQLHWEDDTTMVGYGMSEIVTIGPVEEGQEEVRRIFRLDRGRLVEVIDQPLEEASMVELVAHNMRRPTYYEEPHRHKLPKWSHTGARYGGHSSDYDVPLAECVEEVTQNSDWIGGVPNELVAAALLAQCMSDKHFYFSIWSGSGWKSTVKE